MMEVLQTTTPIASADAGTADGTSSGTSSGTPDVGSMSREEWLASVTKAENDDDGPDTKPDKKPADGAKPVDPMDPVDPVDPNPSDDKKKREEEFKELARERREAREAKEKARTLEAALAEHRAEVERLRKIEQRLKEKRYDELEREHGLDLREWSERVLEGPDKTVMREIEKLRQENLEFQRKLEEDRARYDNELKQRAYEVAERDWIDSVVQRRDSGQYPLTQKYWEVAATTARSLAAQYFQATKKEYGDGKFVDADDLLSTVESMMRKGEGSTSVLSPNASPDGVGAKAQKRSAPEIGRPGGSGSPPKDLGAMTREEFIEYVKAQS